MDIKKLLLVSLGSLVVSIGLMFALLYFLQPPQKSADNERQKKTPAAKAADTMPPVRMPLVSNVNEDSLRNEITILKNIMTEKQKEIDSLTLVLKEKDDLAGSYQSQIDDLKEQMENDRTKDDNAKTLAKTFETMKVSEIARSVASLNDNALIRIYYKMNSRHRKNLLMALSSERASRLTNKMMSLASE